MNVKRKCVKVLCIWTKIWSSKLMTKVLCPAYTVVCLSVWLSFLLFFFFFSFGLALFGFSSQRFLCVAVETHFVDRAGLKFRDLPVCAYQLLKLKACTTMPGFLSIFHRNNYIIRCLCSSRLSPISSFP